MGVNWIFAVKHGLISPDRDDILDLLKSLLSAALMGGAVYFAAQLPAVSGAGRIIGFAVPVFIGVMVYALCTALLRSSEMTALIRVFSSKLKRK